MSKTLTKSRPSQERVVALKEHVAGILGPDGEIVPAEKLEVGTVRELSDNRGVLVHWLPADLDAWMEAEELEPMDPETRVIATYHVGEGEVKTLDKYKLVTSAGLSHNWAIERWPANVVRAIRSDGWAWTFDWYPVYERIFPIRTFSTNLPTDDDAEALTAAELSFYRGGDSPSSLPLVPSEAGNNSH